MVLKLDQFDLEQLATKNTIKILRLMILKPYLSWGLTELSLELSISKSNILRIMLVLTRNNMVLEHKSGRKKVYKVNYQLNINKIFFKLYMEEKRRNITANFGNVVDLFYNQVKDDVNVFILFGSVAQGLATEKSDIDVCVVATERIDVGSFDFLPYRFEVHQYNWDDFENPSDFVVLEALLNGIVYKGDLLDVIAETTAFSKNYLIYRLEKAKEFLSKSKSLEGEAKSYYEKLAKVTIGEVKSVILNGKTIPKKEIHIIDMEQELEELENRISGEGENVWLI
jgi:predicted nucleotidyltransferase